MQMKGFIKKSLLIKAHYRSVHSERKELKAGWEYYKACWFSQFFFFCAEISDLRNNMLRDDGHVRRYYAQKIANR